MQDYDNTIAEALQLQQPCAKPSTCRDIATPPYTSHAAAQTAPALNDRNPAAITPCYYFSILDLSNYAEI